MLTTRQIMDAIKDMQEGDCQYIDGVNIVKYQLCWWTQAGGGCEFSKSADRAAQKVRRLANYLKKILS